MGKFVSRDAGCGEIGTLDIFQVLFPAAMRVWVMGANSRGIGPKGWRGWS